MFCTVYEVTTEVYMLGCNRGGGGPSVNSIFIGHFYSFHLLNVTTEGNEDELPVFSEHYAMMVLYLSYALFELPPAPALYQHYCTCQ